MCKKEDCPIYDSCDKEHDQALYCRKVELLLHLSRHERFRKPKINYVRLPLLPVLM